MMLLSWLLIFILCFLGLWITGCFDKHKADERRKTIIVLGSGGHTAEMLKFLKTLKVELLGERVYVIAGSDIGSLSKIMEFENGVEHLNIEYIPRSREVGQSYFTSVFTTLYSMLYCTLVIEKVAPDLVIANGPGTCLPILFCAWIHKTLGLSRCKLVLLESYACVKNRSLTGRLMLPFVDKYFVQWPSLLSTSSKVVYSGRVPISAFREKFPRRVEKPRTLDTSSYVLVVVGSTNFDNLIRSIDTEEFARKLHAIGYNGIKIQVGTGTYQVTALHSFSSSKFQVEIHKFIFDWEYKVRSASLVIGHSGAGTILDALEFGKPLIVVENECLMNRHQSEITGMMRDLGYIVSSDLNHLVDEIEQLCKATTYCLQFPKTESGVFRDYIESLYK
ncbi:UDP-N-acetylglucosamine--N-acetylmuramyl-(pentapeptide) pyrophosphoryl-undecaprenol N-acetylglucosamine transferase 1-like isoform X2 [Schistocerca gregaria]|uniref:UDP-N-acetylglucosamine--N-acetylmuramyl- (pentapeptide) pyrophosphoryl-undecaprenol N-acetylglucosamine transferase 1-like isoform X2 n=1 Tax=Schistocerca gregaria TaxID=7010 RepID=UPI00211E9908|nr:UDP-N-acetylglucosamine--N-acetylmuramyl-(pentapeptide) pyrophosphoryl-undecaprenol N-acetylglucosamine transferase 1-like isoform X2 [Schistocerca gregaria]